jgi:spore coat polysaccharide biosynthesis protein SpsF (cytidylyltransferase family)
MEKVVAIIEARMGSSRLPGKSLRPIAGAPLVQRVAERARRAKSLDAVVIATSTSPKDDVLAEHMQKQGFPVHRGSELDVLGRILGAAHANEASIHVQCWGDCPFLEPTEIDRVVAALRETGADLVGNGLGKDRQLPYGLDVIAMKVSALEAADAATRDNPYHREHGTTYIYETAGAFRVHRIETAPDLRYPDFNVTINEESDYQLVTAIYDALYPTNPAFGIRDVIALLRSRPDLLAHPNARALAQR